MQNVAGIANFTQSILHNSCAHNYYHVHMRATKYSEVALLTNR